MSAINTVPELLRAQASRIPEQPFVRWRGRSVSYAEFDTRTDALAAGLADLGVKPGDVVSVMLPNCLEFLEAWWAVLKAGAVFGPINPAFTAPEAAYVVGHSQAVAVVKGLDLNPEIVNVNGGAIALGHPMGCTGTKLSIQLFDELRLRGQKYGMVTMCVGTGQGAAGIFELLN